MWDPHGLFINSFCKVRLTWEINKSHILRKNLKWQMSGSFLKMKVVNYVQIRITSKFQGIFFIKY